jgi:hypothetical protein
MSITVPPDVAEVLDGVDNASAYIADAVRKKARLERLHATFARRGLSVTPEGVARAGEKLRAAEERRRRRVDAG